MDKPAPETAMPRASEEMRTDEAHGALPTSAKSAPISSKPIKWESVPWPDTENLGLTTGKVASTSSNSGGQSFPLRKTEVYSRLTTGLQQLPPSAHIEPATIAGA